MQPQKRNEHPSTYYVQDRSNEEELKRLLIQDRMLTASMGGVLPEQSDPSAFQRVLDVACGTGGWLIEVAKAYSTMTRLVGVDVSKKMIDYARAQAKEQQVDDRVEFAVMDALRMLEFPSGFFDLVNMRLGVSFMRTWDWPKLLQEFVRVTKPAGIIRITDTSNFESESPAQLRIAQLILETSFRSGRFFSRSYDGLTSELVHLMSLHKIQNIQTREYHLVYRAETPEGQMFCEDMAHFYRVALPFFQKWANVPEDYEATCQRAFEEMQAPGFVATMTLLTAWGICPE